MKILINNTAATPTSGGIYTTLTTLYEEITHFKNDDIQWIFLLSGPYLKETDNIQIITIPKLKESWLQRLSFELFYGRKMVNRISPDIYVTLQNTATLGVKAIQIVYMQQTLHFFTNRYSFSFLKVNERKMAVYQHLIGNLIEILMRIARPKVIVQTSWLKEQIRLRLKYKPEDVFVCPPTVSYPASDVRQSSLSEKEVHFFYPAAYYPYKNHRMLIEICKKLVDDGYTNFTLDLTLNASDFETTEEFPPQIHLLGKLSKTEVFEHYRRSILLFPSIIESFGLPLAEAASVGATVICQKLRPQIDVLKGYEGAHFYQTPGELYTIMKKILLKEISIDPNPSGYSYHDPNGKTFTSIIQKFYLDGEFSN